MELKEFKCLGQTRDPESVRTHLVAKDGNSTGGLQAPVDQGAHRISALLCVGFVLRGHPHVLAKQPWQSEMCIYQLGNRSRKIISFLRFPSEVLGLALIGLMWSHANP